MTVDIAIIIAIIGCLVGLAGWLSNHDKHNEEDAEWRGSVNGKLDAIVGIKDDVRCVDDRVSALAERTAKVEASTASAHKRLDEHINDHRAQD